MKARLKKQLYIFLGCFFVLVGAIGALFPILPTTPFLLLALALFANSSPRFHQALLNNRWFGATLRQWEEKKTVSQQVKLRAGLLIILSFSVSIFFMRRYIEIQIILVVTAFISLFFIWMLKEE